ncbi:MAG: hydroxymethylbilane synthase [Dehalococcoidia bacterium]|nr:hydroxymethylbilane synthase [Dehalococcoidia bacterium]
MGSPEGFPLWQGVWGYYALAKADPLVWRFAPPLPELERRYRVRNLNKPFILGTRGSALALRQTDMIVMQLRKAHPDVEFVVEIRSISTEGDRQSTVPLTQIAGRGVFVKDIEMALLAGEIDVAVHSLKDMPSVITPGLTIAAVSEREDPRDVIVSKRGFSFNALPREATVGTSSIRRSAQLLALRPDLKMESLRGNVDTRLRKALDGEHDAIIVAAAGVLRLDRKKDITEYLSYETCLPAVGQGVLAVETREDDEETIELVSSIDCGDVHNCIIAERVFLHELGGGCLVPIAGFGVGEDGELCLRGMVCSPDGRNIIRDEMRGDLGSPIDVARALVQKFLQRGAQKVIEEYEQSIQAR